MSPDSNLIDDIDGMIRRKTSSKLADRAEIIDALINFAGFDESDRDGMRETPIGVLETHAANSVPGAHKVDDGLVIDDDDATANADMDVDPDDFGTGSIAPDTGGMTSGDFTSSMYGDSSPTANEHDDLDVDDFGSGVIGE